MAAGLRRAFRQRRKEDNSRCFRCGTGGDRVSGGAELGRADRGSWEPDNLLGAGAASATGRQGAMGSRLCQAQGDPGRVDSAPTGLFDQNGGDDVDRRDSGGRGQGLWPRTPELRKRHSARCDARSEEHTAELQSLMRISYAVFCLKKKNNKNTTTQPQNTKNTNITYNKATTHYKQTNTQHNLHPTHKQYNNYRTLLCKPPTNQHNTHQ